jgi:hypothetical protein
MQWRAETGGLERVVEDRGVDLEPGLLGRAAGGEGLCDPRDDVERVRERVFVL